MPVEPITKDIKKEIIRSSLEQIVLGNIPFVGSAIAKYGRIFIQSEFDNEIDRWRSDVTNLLNQLEGAVERLSQCMSISDLSFQVGLVVSSLSVDGIAEPFEISDLLGKMPDVVLEELIEACGELSHIGLLELSQRVNSLGSLEIYNDFFKVFDPFVHGWYPEVDAASLAVYVANQSKNESICISADTIASHFDWRPRRLNPALLIVGEYISDARKCTSYTPPWAHKHIWADPKERAALRQMARDILGK
ncbi:MAG: hypothetical protein ABW101_02320 [Candidatus Thiodiazotropha sp.]